MSGHGINLLHQAAEAMASINRKIVAAYVPRHLLNEIRLDAAQVDIYPSSSPYRGFCIFGIELHEGTDDHVILELEKHQ